MGFQFFFFHRATLADMKIQKLASNLEAALIAAPTFIKEQLLGVWLSLASTAGTKPPLTSLRSRIRVTSCSAGSSQPSAA